MSRIFPRSSHAPSSLNPQWKIHISIQTTVDSGNGSASDKLRVRFDERLEHDLHLESGQVHPRADVCACTASQLVADIAIDVKPIGVP
jgi:hypothetical protein